MESVLINWFVVQEEAKAATPIQPDIIEAAEAGRYDLVHACLTIDPQLVNFKDHRYSSPSGYFQIETP